jgi:hypothetical protein
VPISATKSAMNGLMHRSKQHPYGRSQATMQLLEESSAVATLDRGLIQNHYSWQPLNLTE